MQEASRGLIEINNAKIRYKSFFVASGRRFSIVILVLRMTCSGGLVPIAVLGFAYDGMEPPELITLKINNLMTALIGTLGLVSLRNTKKVEKLKKIMRFAKYSEAQKSWLDQQSGGQKSERLISKNGTRKRSKERHRINVDSQIEPTYPQPIEP